jgi:2-haloacid dehalogenase
MAVGEAPRVVVFDLGNVIVRWDRRLLYRQLFATDAETDRFCNEVYTLEANQRLDLGQSLHDFTAALADEHPRYAREILALRTRWIETIGEFNEETIALVAELRAFGRPVYALSNWNAETFALVEHRHPVFSWFDGVVLSGREGVGKPDPAIYRLLCERHGFAPQDALFIDDAPANVAAAQAVGMRAVIFTDVETLRDDLAAHGVLSGSH